MNGAIAGFRRQGFPCPQFKNPTDYFLTIVSDHDNAVKLAAAQKQQWDATTGHIFDQDDAASDGSVSWSLPLAPAMAPTFPVTDTATRHVYVRSGTMWRLV